MLVEDDDALRAMMTDQFQTIGLDVVAVSTAVAAWDLIEAGLAYDLLLADEKTPGKLTGTDLAARLKRAYPNRPVIVLTGHMAPDMLNAQLVSQGIDGVSVLSKPCRPSVLAAAVVGALGL